MACFRFHSANLQKNIEETTIYWIKFTTFALKKPKTALQSTMQELNLPHYNVKVKEVDGKIKIWDCLRKSFIVLTPEEWVRQHFVNFLINEKGYSSVLLANEVSIALNGMSRRCDSVLYSQQLVPRMIIEYKRPTVKITQKVFNQICRYNLSMHVDYLIVSNGLEHYCCKMDYENQSYTFLDDIPAYADL